MNRHRCGTAEIEGENCLNIWKEKLLDGRFGAVRNMYTKNAPPFSTLRDPAGKMPIHKMKSYWASKEIVKAARFASFITDHENQIE